MTLIELADPIFQYMCRLNRVARCAGGAGGTRTGETSFFSASGPAAGVPAAARSSSLDYATVRGQIKGLLEDFRQKSAGDARLAEQARKMELPLLFFIDSMISESRLPFAGDWNQARLAYDRNELAGDDKFFELLEETLRDNSEEASERLAIFYTCLGLGFTGIYFRQPEYLRKTMLTIAPRIRQVMEADHSAKICPENYENIDTRNLVQTPGGGLALIGAIFACFVLAAIASYYFIYRETSDNLSGALSQILTNAPAAVSAAAPK